MESVFLLYNKELYVFYDMHLSSDRSLVRTNQNLQIIELIISCQSEHVDKKSSMMPVLIA